MIKIKITIVTSLRKDNPKKYLFLDFNLFDVFIQTPNLNNIILFNSSVLAFIIPNITLSVNISHTT